MRIITVEPNVEKVLERIKDDINDTFISSDVRKERDFYELKKAHSFNEYEVTIEVKKYD